MTCVVAANADDYKKCVYHYFRSGGISTSECYDKDHRFGKATAYDRTGKLIYEKEVRRVGGAASVAFSYYSSGAVSKAHWHSAPDGGIQWYNTITTFSEEGKVTGETEDNYDHSPGTLLQRPATTPRPERQTVVKCAVIYCSEYWFINTTPYRVEVTTNRGSEHSTVTLQKKETHKGGQLILAEQFDDPSKYYQFKVTPIKPSVKERFIIIPAERKPEQAGKEARRYYFEIRRIL